MGTKAEVIRVHSTVSILRKQPGAPPELLAQKVSNDQIAVLSFEVEPARTGFGIGGTWNLGDFESARADVRLDMPCYREELFEVFEATQIIVEAKMEEQLQSIRSFITTRKF
jgi:hypothetical protein